MRALRLDLGWCGLWGLGGKRGWKRLKKKKVVEVEAKTLTCFISCEVLLAIIGILAYTLREFDCLWNILNRGAEILIK